MTKLYCSMLTAIQLLAAGGSALAQSTSLTVVERATTDVVSVHGGKDPDNVGDILTFANEVFDVANQVKVGFDQGYCVRMVVGKAFECHWTLTLADGQITVDGPFLDAGDSVLAIVGGTGVYIGANGEMKLHARDAKASGYDFTYTIKRG